MTFQGNILKETLEELAGPDSRNTLLINLDLTGANVKMQSLRYGIYVIVCQDFRGNDTKVPISKLIHVVNNLRNTKFKFFL